jgi:hypothetical protein
MEKEAAEERESWYKVDNKRKVENQESKVQYNPPSKKRKMGKKDNNSKNTDKKIKSVMFVPYTKHSELATRLRESEESMTGYKLKIVERGGTKANLGQARILGGRGVCCAPPRGMKTR